MKVLVINGSSREKGNLNLLCDEFLMGAREAGHQVEKISLRKKVITPCKTCYACFKRRQRGLYHCDRLRRKSRTTKSR